MKNFARALRSSIGYWPSLAAAACCSFMVAALWGANIGAFFPILEVTIQGRSAQDWFASEVERQEEKLSDIDQRRQEAQAIGDTREKTKLDYEYKARSAKLYSYQRMQPYVARWFPNDPFETIGWIVGALVASTCVKHVFLIASELLVGRVALSITARMRNDLFSQALSLDRASFTRFGQPNFVTSIIHTADVLSQGLMAALGAALREPLKIIACVVGACAICWRLFVLSCIVAPIVGLALYILTKSIKAISGKVLQQATGFHAVLLEGLNNIQTVQSFQREKSEREKFEQTTALMKRFGLKFIFFSSLSKPIIEFLGIGMLGTTIVAGSYLVLKDQTSILGIQISDDQLSTSALFVFFGMLIGMSDPLRKLSSVYGSIYTGGVAADVLYPLLDQQSEIVDTETPVEISRPHRELRLSEIGFQYSENQPVLEGVSLDIPFGSTVAIIGANGSGKSTLINLLCRFYDPVHGGISLDGTDYRDLSVEDVRSRFALVNQSTELFDETVAYNIRYGRPDATDEEVLKVSRDAHAHEFISTVLEEGYDTKVGLNGSRLSGGQRQRIALARALLCDPEILILDESTSQIDMKSEDLICQSLAEHRGERTMIIITHREKLLELADDVYQLDRGQLSKINWQHRAAA